MRGFRIHSIPSILLGSSFQKRRREMNSTELKRKKNIVVISTKHCIEYPDTIAAAKAIESLGWTASIECWEDFKSIDWSRFDCAVIRTPWGYHNFFPQWLEFLAHVSKHTRLFNSAQILGWNSDKKYMQQLESSGIPVVPTVFLGQDSNKVGIAGRVRSLMEE